jgi:hypothetical protein
MSSGRIMPAFGQACSARSAPHADPAEFATL